MNVHRVSSGQLSAVIRAHGAELCSLRGQDGHELLWQAGEAWPRYAPNLFPIVGRLKNDTLRYQGREYRMTQHGFARDREFAWLEKTSHSCRLILHEDSQTMKAYPFSFSFEIAYAIEGDALRVEFLARNTGRSVLPVSFGAHPAFCWPLRKGIEKNTHHLAFSHEESHAAWRLRDGLLAYECVNPVKRKILDLNDGLFAEDAVIFKAPASKSVFYGVPGVSGLRISWDEGFQQLGVWSKSGADFVCIEPWNGMASPIDFNGDILDKPGIMLIPPNASRIAHYSVSPTIF